jgi:hypothetical protein
MTLGLTLNLTPAAVAAGKVDARAISNQRDVVALGGDQRVDHAVDGCRRQTWASISLQDSFRPALVALI